VRSGVNGFVEEFPGLDVFGSSWSVNGSASMVRWNCADHYVFT